MSFGNLEVQFNQILKNHASSFSLLDKEKMLEMVEPIPDDAEIVGEIVYDHDLGVVLNSKKEYIDYLEKKYQAESRESKSANLYNLTGYKKTEKIFENKNAIVKELEARENKLYELYHQCYEENDMIIKENNYDLYFHNSLGFEENNYGFDLKVFEKICSKSYSSIISQFFWKIQNKRYALEGNRRKLMSILDKGKLILELYDNCMYFAETYEKLINFKIHTLSKEEIEKRTRYIESVLSVKYDELHQERQKVLENLKILDDCRTWAEYLLTSIVEIQKGLIDAIIDDVAVELPKIEDIEQDAKNLAKTAATITFILFVDSKRVSLNFSSKAKLPIDVEQYV